MDSAQHSCSFSPGPSSESSGHYADVESASNLRLISSNNNSASVIFPGRNSSSRASTVISVIALIVSSLCLMSVASVVCFWVYVVNDGALLPQSSRPGGREGEVCLPCLQVSPNPLDSSPSDLWAELDVRLDRENNDTKICCAFNTAQYAALFKLILLRQEEVKKLADLAEPAENPKNVAQQNVSSQAQGMVAVASGTSSVSAHLVFNPRAQRAKDSDRDKYQHWKSPQESPVSHVRGGLKFVDRRGIFVQAPGYYFVYCQVLYTPSSSSSAAAANRRDSPTIASTYVRRYSILHPTAPDFLLKARHTRHDLGHDRHSSYVGGVFWLNRGDSLYVQVSRPDLVSHDDVASFFGLFKVGE